MPERLCSVWACARVRAHARAPPRTCPIWAGLGTLWASSASCALGSLEGVLGYRRRPFLHTSPLPFGTLYGDSAPAIAPTYGGHAPVTEHGSLKLLRTMRVCVYAVRFLYWIDCMVHI